MTKRVNIPEHCVITDFRVPVNHPITANGIGTLAEHSAAIPNTRALVFKWDRQAKDSAGNPILDLVNIV